MGATDLANATAARLKSEGEKRRERAKSRAEQGWQQKRPLTTRTLRLVAHRGGGNKRAIWKGGS